MGEMTATKGIGLQANERNILKNFIYKNKAASMLPMECPCKCLYLQIYVCTANIDFFIDVFMKVK